MRIFKRSLAMLLAVLMLVSMAVVGVSAAVERISTVEDLIAAAKNGGEYVLANDIEVTAQIDVTAESLTINGNYKTIYSEASINIFRMHTKNAVLTLNNLTLDGKETAKRAVVTQPNASNPNGFGMTVKMTNVFVQNFKSNNTAGALYLYSDTIGNFNGCTFTNNSASNSDKPDSAADIWAGAETVVTINGGKVNDIVMNANYAASSTLKVEGEAEVGEITLGSEQSCGADLTITSTSAKVGTVIVTDPATNDIKGKESITTFVKVVYTFDELKAAVDNGEACALGADITVPSTLNIKANANIKIDGNGYTLTAKTDYLFHFVNNTATLSLSDMKLDGANTSKIAINTSGVAVGPMTVNLTNVEVTGFKGSSVYGAVILFGETKGTFTNCNFHDNDTPITDYASGADIWSGAAVDLKIIGGSYEEIFMNADKGAASKLTVEGIVDIDKVVLENYGENNATINDDKLNTEKSSVNVVDYNDTVIGSVEELKAAVAHGGNYTLGADLAINEVIKVEVPTGSSSKFFNLDGNGHTITGKAKKVFEIHTTLPVTFSNMTIANESQHGTGARCVDTRTKANVTIDNCTLTTVNAAKANSSNEHQPITIGGYDNGTKVTVKNSTVKCPGTGSSFAIISFVDAELNIVKSTVEGGATILSYKNKLTANVVNSKLITNATWTNKNDGFAAIIAQSYMKLTVDSASSIKTTGEYTSAVSIGSAYGAPYSVNIDINTTNINTEYKYLVVSEGFAFDNDNYDVSYPANLTFGLNKQGVIVKDGKVYCPLYATQKVANDDVFGSALDAFMNLEILGVQTRSQTLDSDDMRFVTAVNTDLLKIADDYGYVFGKVDASKGATNARVMEIADKLKLDENGRTAGLKVSCATNTNRDNTISDDYGDYDAKTPYKYVTGAIIDIEEADKDDIALALFYITIDGKTYYATYKSSEGTRYNGCASSYTDAIATTEIK